MDGAGLLGQKSLSADSTESPTDGPGGEGYLENSDCTESGDTQLLSDQLLRLINMERFDIGAVERDAELADLATRYACRMIDEGFFGHVHPTTGDGLAERMHLSGYEYASVGENLAAGIDRPCELLDAWLLSEPHREVMLDANFTRAGVGVGHGGEYGTYCVLLLAEPAETDETTR